jgi:hypothetical protein
MATNPWTLDDYNAGKIAVDPARGWSPQDAVDYYNRYHPRDDQTDTGGSKAQLPSPGTATTNQYTGAVDPSLQTVKPATTQLQPSPMPPAPSIPLGPTTGGSSPTSQSLQGTTTPDGTYHFNMGDAANPTTATPTGPVSTTAPPGSQGAMDAQVRQRLLELLGTDTNNVSTQDPDVAPQSRAFNAQVDREAAAQRAQMLEQANAEGTSSSGATQAGLSNLGSQAAVAKGANDASLIGQKQQQRIQQLQNAIQVASSLGMTQQANDLQRQLANLQAQVTMRGQDVTQAGQQIQVGLANLDTSTKLYLADLNARLQREGYGTQERLAQLDAEVRKLGINTQGDLGQLDIALRSQLGVGQLNLGLLSTLLNNNQANNSLGYNYAALLAGLNQNAVTFGGG